MKTLYSLFFALAAIAFLQPSSAQTVFAPIGAEWYNSYSASAFGPTYSYIRSEVSRDTVINGITFQVIDKYRESASSNFLQRSDYVRTIGDKVERLADDSLMYTLYDFSLSVGDTFITKSYDIYEGRDVAIIHEVVATSTITINGQVLRTQQVESLGRADGSSPFGMTFGQHASIPDRLIIERLGNTMYMFPQDYGLWDSDLTRELRCYSDPSFALYETGATSTCDYIYTSTEEIEAEIQLNIYPTIANGQTRIEWDASADVQSIQIFNSLGELTQVLSTSEFQNTAADIQFQTNGMHVIKLTLADGGSVSKKILNY